MGLFSFLGQAAKSFVKKTVSAVSKAADFIAETSSKAVDRVKERLGSASYDHYSMESRVDVESTLADFKEEIQEMAEKAEDNCIMSAMDHFDVFAGDLEEAFPEFVGLVRTRQAETKSRLKGTIINYVQQRISENDPKFQEILEMQPGNEKQDALDRRMKKIIKNAEKAFRKELKAQIKLLNDELNVRLEQKMRSQEELLSSIAKKYEDLEKETADGTLDLKKFEEEGMPVAEAASCIQQLLAQEEGDVG